MAARPLVARSAIRFEYLAIVLLVFDFRAVGFTICQANGAQWLHVSTDRECVLNVDSKHWITSLHFGSQFAAT